MHTNLHDPGFATTGGVSHKPGTALSGGSANNGAGVDMGGGVGNVVGLFLTGDNTGSPTSVALAYKLQESDDNSTFTDISGATASLAASASANNSVATYIVTGKRSKRYVRAVATPTFVGGTSPTQPIASYVFGQSQRT
jgi:hypothetical protein